MTTIRTVEEYPSPQPEWVYLYAIANSAGLIHPERYKYSTLTQAKRVATKASQGGWYGECWPVRLTHPRPQPQPPQQSNQIEQLRAQRDELLAVLEFILPYIPRDQMTYSEGDHGERVYHAEVVRKAIAKTRRGEGNTQ